MVDALPILVVLTAFEVLRLGQGAGATPPVKVATAVTTGASDLGLATPVGTWQVQDKQANRYLVGPGYRDFVSYWVPFDGDFGFHDARWQTMAYGSPDYRTQGSHGCVHLAAPAMAWLIAWARVGATVAVQA